MAAIAKIAGRAMPESPLTRMIERGLRGHAELAVDGLDCRDWAGLVIAVFFTALLASILVIWLLLRSEILAVVFAPATALAASFAVFSLPMVLAQNRIWAMERELPSIISHLLSTYAERRNMHDALTAAVCSAGGGGLGSELKRAYADYVAGADTETAFERLRRVIRSRYVNRTFDLVIRSLESGVDVSRSLEMLAHDVSKTTELVEEKNSKLGMMSWMISASSGFFYPLFTSFGLIIMAALEALASLSLYSPLERSFITLVLVAYLFIGVMLDSSYNGQVKYGDFKRGILVYFPVMALCSFAVFLVSYRSLGAFIGI